uniref:hypothetical protein n=1 Tax=Nonomuraea sp. CA-251285 TaxID=3240002 RepID=UPI003F498703
MTMITVDISPHLFEAALGMAYVKGLVDDPLPPLQAKQVRRLVERVLVLYDGCDAPFWADALRVYPSERDPRTHDQVVADVRAWAEARVRRYVAHYRPRSGWRWLQVDVDTDQYLTD